MTVTIHDLRSWKSEGKRWAMLTAYDFPTAQILDRAGVPVLLVGDSVGRNVLGYANELPVTMEEMLHHTRAVAGGVEHAMVVGDMPFMSFQASIEDGVRNAGRLVKEGGAHAIKLEGAQFDLVHRLVDIGIPVMAHVGLTPQSVYGLGGYRVQGRGERAGRRLPPPEPRSALLPADAGRGGGGIRGCLHRGRGRCDGAVPGRGRSARTVPRDRLRRPRRAGGSLRVVVASLPWAGRRIRDHGRYEHDPLPSVSVLLGSGPRL